MIDLELWNVMVGRDAGGEFAQHRIDERSGGTFAGTLDELNTLIDCSPGGNTAEPAELINGETECDENLEIEFGDWLVRDPGNLGVEQRSPAQNSHDQFRCQGVIHLREPVAHPGMEKFGGVGRLALDAQQDVECCSTGWGDCWLRVSSCWFHLWPV